MIFQSKHKFGAITLLLATVVALQGCDPKTATTQVSTQTDYAPVSVEHHLGTTVINQMPQTVAALDMNEVDFLDQLNIPVAGMPKDFVPHFLEQYKTAPNIQDTGAIVQPNMEKVYATRPDLILITSLQANHYKELSQIAPTIHFDVDYKDSQSQHIEVIKKHLMDLGKIFKKEDLAQQKVDEINTKVTEALNITQNRPERALIVLHNNGSYSSFGLKSRYGFIFNDLGVKPASPEIDTALHGQPISSEFILKTNPDIIYIVDRTAVMESRPTIDAESLSNPLLKETNAWKNGKVIFADAEAWYVTAASPTSLKLIIDDVLKGYRN